MTTQKRLPKRPEINVQDTWDLTLFFQRKRLLKKLLKKPKLRSGISRPGGEKSVSPLRIYWPIFRKKTLWL